MMNLFWLCCIGYFIGSIPTGFLLMKFCKQIDVRDLGSHSTGATNILRSGGKTLAMWTLLGDVLKGALFVLIAKAFSDDCWYLSAVFCCQIGHVYPIWLGFKGGKGVATSAGIFLVLSPLFASISISIWFILAKFVKISSIASIALATSFTALCSYGYFFKDTEFAVFIFSVITFCFLMLTHIDNIKRIIHHSEKIVTLNKE
ncbi:MAG: glycerol-3-phosphate 1-O-acyltransferase PlsY [Alphaproteobacteria bacterium]|nr:glycerol-3-phosphate 1-O-acyltransferase PlsY [Alphaproteobacteria bacterium]